MQFNQSDGASPSRCLAARRRLGRLRARALARPDVASDSSLREIVEFRERGCTVFTAPSVGDRSSPVGRETGCSELSRVHALRRVGLTPDVRRV